MKLVVEKLPDLQALYAKELRLLLSAHEMIAIKSMFLAEMATDDELKEIFLGSCRASEKRVHRVRELLSRTTRESEPIKCRTVYALFDEAEDAVQDAAHNSVRDAALIAVARRIKHYELSYCEGVRQFARALQCYEDVRIFDDLIREERAADLRLANITDRVNAAAKKSP